VTKAHYGNALRPLQFHPFPPAAGKIFLFNHSNHYLRIEKIMLTAHPADHAWIEVASNYALEIVSTNALNGTIPHTVLLAALLDTDAVLPVFDVSLPYPLDHHEQAQGSHPASALSTQLQIRLIQHGPTAIEQVRVELLCVPVPQVAEL
jgi:hypothetical protein